MLFTWTKSHWNGATTSVVFGQEMVVYLNRLPAFLAFTLLSRPWLQVCSATETFVLMWTRPAETSPASVSWGGFWLCNFFQSTKKLEPRNRQYQITVFWEKNSKLHFQKFGSVFNPKENVIVYDLDWDVKVSYQCDQVTPNRLCKTPGLCYAELGEGPFLHPKKQWKSVEEAVNIPGSYQRFACGLGKIQPSTWLKPLKNPAFFFSCL